MCPCRARTRKHKRAPTDLHVFVCVCVGNRLRGGSTRGLQLSKPRDRGATGLWGEQTQRLPLVIMNEAALDRRGGGGRAAQDDDLKGIVAGWYPTCHSRARRGTEEEHGLILVGVGLRGPGFVEPRLEATTSGANKAADWQSFEAGRRRLGWQREPQLSRTGAQASRSQWAEAAARALSCSTSSRAARPADQWTLARLRGSHNAVRLFTGPCTPTRGSLHKAHSGQAAPPGPC